MKLYRFLTDVDTSAFSHKISAALNNGWELQGPPVYAFDAVKGALRCGQAIVKETEGEYSPKLKLTEM